MAACHPQLLLVLVSRAQQTDPKVRLCERDLPGWEIPELRNLVTQVKVRRTSQRPFFGVNHVTEFIDQTLAVLKRKFDKTYKTSASSIELLAYFAAHPAPKGADWRAEISKFITANLARSPFQRVWLFDTWLVSEGIVLVVPPVS